MDLLLLIWALLGHAFLWVALVNRIHAIGMRRWIIKILTVGCFAWLAALPLAAAWWCWAAGPRVFDFLRNAPWNLPGTLVAWTYLLACWIGAAVIVPLWVRRRLLRRPPDVLRLHHRRRLPVETSAHPAAEDHAHHLLVGLPGNESLQLELTERTIELPLLPPALDGLSVVHLSDLHFTGMVGKAYFREIVRLSNELEPDLVAVTGDIVDKSRYIDWIPETLGRLTARYGVYFILGNHDLRVDVSRLLRTLHDCGLTYVGGRFRVVKIRDEPVVLAGNELPWRRRVADLTRCPPRDGGPLRIVLAHSPDQLKWAQAQDADLMLAGHTHGGQIRLPWIGPIFAPSRLGVTYASGLFHAPPVVMHVTRGLSGELPLRLNCRPEMARLELKGRSQGSGIRD